MVGQGHLQMKDDVGRFAGDFGSYVVLAGHHELGTLLANLFEDAVVAPGQQFVGVAVSLGMVAAALNHPHQFGADVGRGRRGGGSARRRRGGLLEKAAAGAGVTGHIAALLDRQQQHICIAVVTNPPQTLDVAAGGALVPELLAGAAPIVHLASGQAALNRLLIHPGHHQHCAIQPVLGHGWNQAGLVEAQAFDQLASADRGICGRAASGHGGAVNWKF